MAKIKRFYKICSGELLDIYDSLDRYEANVFNNSFRVWKAHSRVARLFSALLPGEPDADGPVSDCAAACSAFLSDGPFPVYICHSMAGAKTAYLLKLFLERKHCCKSVMSGDLSGCRDELLTALQDRFRLEPDVAPFLSDTCPFFLRHLEQECISRCSVFILLLPDGMEQGDAALPAKYTAKAPWMEEELGLARSISRKSDPSGLSFLQPCSLKDLLELFAAKILDKRPRCR